MNPAYEKIYAFLYECFNPYFSMNLPELTPDQAGFISSGLVSIALMAYVLRHDPDKKIPRKPNHRASGLDCVLNEPPRDVGIDKQSLERDITEHFQEWAN